MDSRSIKMFTQLLMLFKHSQEYIKQLNKQLEEASEGYKGAMTMEQVLAELKAPATHPTAPSGPFYTRCDC